MTAWDARHWRERMLMLFIAPAWLPLPLYLRMSQSLMHSCSQQLSQAENSLPKAVLEARRFALGKWTIRFEACPQTVSCKPPAAGTTSSKDMLLPSTCAQLSLLSPEATALLEALLPSITLPTSLAIPLQSTPSHSTKHNQKNNSIKPGKIKWKYSPKTCWHKTTLASALPDQLQGLHSLSLRSGAALCCLLLTQILQQGQAGKLLPGDPGTGRSMEQQHIPTALDSPSFTVWIGGCTPCFAHSPWWGSS